MNLIDLAVLLMFVLFILAGIYKGFISSMLSIAANVVCWACGMIFMPIVSNIVTGNSKLFNMLLYYTEGSEYIGDVELAKTSIEAISQKDIASIVKSSSLPFPFGKEIIANVKNRAFAGSGAITLGDYYNQTIVCVVINIISLFLIFFILRLLIGFLIEGVNYTLRFPELTQLNKSLSGAGGFINGVGILFVLFAVLPIMLIVLNFPFIHDIVDNSLFAPIFYHASWLLSFIPGTC